MRKVAETRRDGEEMQWGQADALVSSFPSLAWHKSAILMLIECEQMSWKRGCSINIPEAPQPLDHPIGTHFPLANAYMNQDYMSILLVAPHRAVPYIPRAPSHVPLRRLRLLDIIDSRVASPPCSTLQSATTSSRIPPH